MINDKNFWSNLENEDNRILKFNENGDYGNRHFTEDEIKLLESFQKLPPIPEFHVGDVVTGKISHISKKKMYIDINYKDSIYVEIKASEYKLIENLNIGDKINVMITSIKETPYEIKGSITELIKIDVANKLKEYYKNNIALDATVTELIPAGFILDIEMNNITLNAFMPNTLAGVNKLTPEQSQALVGQKIKVILESLQQEKGVYVVSRKKYLTSLIPDEIAKLNKNTVYTGTVTGTKDFGIFVEFNGCLTGMIHKVNLNEDWQDKMDEILPGFEVDFYIQDILKGNRIILTQNVNNESLWDTIRVNQIKEGTVIAVKSFGVLISLDHQTMGLIQTTYLKKANKTLKKGEKVKVKVISVIKDERKIYLNFAD